MSAWTYRPKGGKVDRKIVPRVFKTQDGRDLSADSEEKREPARDIQTAELERLKVLDLKRPIREADIS